MRIGLDFSGTLADDMAAVYAASRTVLASLGLEMPSFADWTASGCANMGEFLERFGVPTPLPEYSRLLRAAWGAEAQARGALSTPYEGIGALLRSLKAAGHVLFLVSSCWQDVLDAELRAHGWKDLFEGVIGGLGAKRDTIAALGLDVYVGDTLSDLRACAGITPFVAVGYGYTPPEQFTEAGVGAVVDSPLKLGHALGLSASAAL